MTSPQPPKRTFGQTLIDIVTTFQQAPVNPLQHALRQAIAGDDLLQDYEYELLSALGTLENSYHTAQAEFFDVMKQNAKIEDQLHRHGIAYQTLPNTPIVIHFDLDDAVTGYDLAASNQPRKARKVSQLQQEVQQLRQDYEQLAQDLEEQKVQQTYLTLKVVLHGLPDPFAKSEVDEYQDAVATLLETTKRQQDAKDEKTRHKVASQRIAQELYTQDPLLTQQYEVVTLQQILDETEIANSIAQTILQQATQHKDLNTKVGLYARAMKYTEKRTRKNIAENPILFKDYFELAFKLKFEAKYNKQMGNEAQAKVYASQLLSIEPSATNRE